MLFHFTKICQLSNLSIWPNTDPGKRILHTCQPFSNEIKPIILKFKTKTVAKWNVMSQSPQLSNQKTPIVTNFWLCFLIKKWSTNTWNQQNIKPNNPKMDAIIKILMPPVTNASVKLNRNSSTSHLKRNSQSLKTSQLCLDKSGRKTNWKKQSKKYKVHLKPLLILTAKSLN